MTRTSHEGKPDVLACAMYGPSSNVTRQSQKGTQVRRAINPNPEAEPRLPPRARRKVCVPIALRTQLMSQPGLAAHPFTGVSRLVGA